jgi:lauroyl/myristoyl acyltransferase
VKINLRRLTFYLFVGFLIFLVWRFPQSMAANAGDFLGAIGGIIVGVIDRISEFLGNLSRS